MAERRYGSEFYFESEPPPELKEKIETQVRKLEVWTVFPYPEGSVLNLGHVSHHIIVGTGPLSTIAATFSELLSQNDEVYQERLESAEAVCLRRIKEKAFSKGASAVVGLESSITELRAGRGMFLYSMSGTAVAPVRLYHP
jgi:uncharacterized protein YbjQ (UPF0145 family)